ncbi:MAG: hypothetical protein STSR0009_27630 [Methanoregula sp.]
MCIHLEGGLVHTCDSFYRFDVKERQSQRDMHHAGYYIAHRKDSADKKRKACNYPRT